MIRSLSVQLIYEVLALVYILGLYNYLKTFDIRYSLHTRRHFSVSRPQETLQYCFSLSPYSPVSPNLLSHRQWYPPLVPGTFQGIWARKMVLARKLAARMGRMGASVGSISLDGIP